MPSTSIGFHPSLVRHSPSRNRSIITISTLTSCAMHNVRACVGACAVLADDGIGYPSVLLCVLDSNCFRSQRSSGPYVSHFDKKHPQGAHQPDVYPVNIPCSTGACLELTATADAQVRGQASSSETVPGWARVVRLRASSRSSGKERAVGCGLTIELRKSPNDRWKCHLTAV